MNKVLILTPILAILYGCASQPNYNYISTSSDATLKFESDFTPTDVYVQHSKSTRFYIGEISGGAFYERIKLSADVPTGEPILVTTEYNSGVGAYKKKCGPLKAVFIAEPKKTYLVRMNNMPGEGTWPFKTRGSCKLSIVDTATNKSILEK